MKDFLYELSKSVQGNLTITEVILLIGAGAISLYGRRKYKVLPFLYGVFLIVYITLLRRMPGYREEIRFQLQLWNSAGILAGNVWNVLLYFPFGWAATRVWKKMDWTRITLMGIVLSGLCELLQFLTACGTADLNDLFSNGIGAAAGAITARGFDRKDHKGQK